MNHLARLLAMTAALMLAVASAHAFTMTDQSSPNTASGQGATNYGSTLTDPGSQIRTYQGLDLSTPNGSTTTTQEGFSFRFGAGPMGSDTNRRLAPPAWSTDPLYLERDH